MSTERKALPDALKLVVENLGLKLTIMQMQADSLNKERMQLLEAEATKLGCLGWQFDLQKMEFIAPEAPPTQV